MKRLLVIGGLVVVLAGIAGAAWALRGTGVTRWVRDPRMVMKPAKLAPVHEAVEELTDCNACHALDAPIPQERCLECHEIIAERRAAKLGHHGKNLLGTCHDCHVDHEPELIEFDRDAFNHEQAIFSLRGRHADLACKECHEKPTGIDAQPRRMQYIGLEHDTCSACHEDPHGGALVTGDRTCLDCHDQDAWTGRHLRFVHDRDATFRLEGKHADVACAGCHVPPEGSTRLADATFAGLGTACSDCHQDPHANQFGDRACATCHSTGGFTGTDLRFDHATVADFRLEGGHATVACTECHVEDAALGARRFEGLSTECAACHESPHGDQFEQAACADCHVTRGFTGADLRFDHRDVTAFPLGGKHVSVECAQCHVPAVDAVTTFRGTSSACATCHEGPHGGQFADTTCATCHRDSGFTGDELAFRHAALERFPLTGAHATVECAGCHQAPAPEQPVVFRGPGTACASCHDDPHAGSVAGKACATCHATTGWKGTNLLFDHARDAAFSPGSLHEAVDCASCHDMPAFTPLETECASCHTDVSGVMAGRPPRDTGSPALEPSPHSGLVDCVKCHDPTDRGASTATIAPRCVNCHNPRYAKLAVDRQALLDDLLLRGRRALDDSAPGTAASASRERLEALRSAASHNFAPAEQQLRNLVHHLERKP